ncbi:MAG: helix-turn-helix domain-containing protein [Puniceicoccaceae bacterium]|nr:MAG: helix-turn-helix domain-containing protein [Puniceicoccaceae bacterium]
MANRPQVALFIETSNSYGRELLAGIRDHLRPGRGWSVLLGEQGRGAGPPGWLRRWRGDGLIARVENEAIARELRRLELPVVDVSAALRKPLFPRVVTNHEKVVALAVEHFAERGLRRFAFCGDGRFHWSRVRGELFQREVERRGREGRVRQTCRAGPRRELAELGRWLRDLPKPVGLLACYDLRARQVLEACRETGLRVPEEVAVMGIHNDVLLCEFCDPPLTSVAPNARLAGLKAATLLEELMAGRRVESRDHPIDPLGVVTRQSTDVVALEDPRLAQAVRFIRRHANEGIGVRDVLKAAPMARTVLERGFREVLGTTPRAFIERTRLERVRHLLATTHLSLEAVAEATGFAHPEYLSVVFRRAMGMTPSAYRRNHQG